MNAIDWITRLGAQGKLEQRHVEAAARFESLVYSGFPNKSPSPERIGGTVSRPQSYMPSLSGLRLKRLPEDVRHVLRLVICDGVGVIELGRQLGARSKMSAYRRGLERLRDALETAARSL